jgi:hypothetical protein
VAEETSLHDPDGCFGVQPEHELRLAVIDTGAAPLLAWARVSRDNPAAPDFYADFEHMLGSIRFR